MGRVEGRRAESEGAIVNLANYTVIEAPQRSPEWYNARAGRLTGSSAADMLSTRKDKTEAADRRKLRLRLVCERVTGRAEDDDAFITRELQRGIALESTAAAAYEAATGQIARWSGFLSHNERMVGCSLDGHIGDPVVGIIEIKCPKSTTHLGYLQSGVVPEEYLPQATHNLWVSGAEWCDFVSFDDRFPEPLQLFIARVTRAQIDFKDYDAKAMAFLKDVDRDVEAVLKSPQVILSLAETLQASLDERTFATQEAVR